jgi:hypothetical protein
MTALQMDTSLSHISAPTAQYSHRPHSSSGKSSRSTSTRMDRAWRGTREISPFRSMSACQSYPAITSGEMRMAPRALPFVCGDDAPVRVPEQQCLYFRPEPHGQGWLRSVFIIALPIWVVCNQNPHRTAPTVAERPASRRCPGRNALGPAADLDEIERANADCTFGKLRALTISQRTLGRVIGKAVPEADRQLRAPRGSEGAGIEGRVSHDRKIWGSGPRVRPCGLAK